MDMSTILRQMGILFILIAVGFAANKGKLMSGEANKWISKLVINVTRPCTILNSVLSGSVEATGLTTIVFFGLTFGVVALGFLIGYFVPRFLRVDRSEWGLYRYMLAFANVGFMGYPVCEAIFGPQSTFYVALFNILFSILNFSVGVMLVSGGVEHFNPKKLLNPALICSVLTMIIFFTKLRFPSIVCDAVSSLGKVTTPAGMLVIGSTLAMIPPRQVFLEWRVYPVTFVRLFLTPAVTFLILKQIVSDPLQLGILTVLSAMPTSTAATMLCMEYGANENAASKVVFLTTLLSIATIPLTVYLLLM